MLCVAKLAAQLQTDTRPAQFSALLLRQKSGSEDERIVEVHIWGSMTRRTFEQVVIASPSRSGRPSKTRLKALRERLSQAGVPLRVI